jgi:hypothetical protein
MKSAGAKSTKASKAAAKADEAPGHEALAAAKAEAKAAGQEADPKANPDQPDRVDVVRAPVPDSDGFHRTRNYQKEDGTNVIQELQGNTWVDVEERPRTNG